MKIRQGFVSNSSSSSFIAVGVKKSLVPKNIREEYENSLDYFESDETPSGEEMLGRLIDTFEYENGEVTIKELEIATREIAQTLNIPDHEVIIFYGHRYC